MNGYSASSLDGKLSFRQIGGQGGGAFIGLPASNPDFKHARFQHPFAAFIGEGHLPGSQAEPDGLFFSGGKMEAGETLQLKGAAQAARPATSFR